MAYCDLFDYAISLLNSKVQMGSGSGKYWIEEMVLRQWIVYKLLLKNQNQLKSPTARIINDDKIRT